jgi:hypothetical protein
MSSVIKKCSIVGTGEKLIGKGGSIAAVLIVGLTGIRNSRHILAYIWPSGFYKLTFLCLFYVFIISVMNKQIRGDGFCTISPYNDEDVLMLPAGTRFRLSFSDVCMT